MSQVTSPAASVAHVPFHGIQLVTVKTNDGVFVAMKPIVEGMGLAWTSQRAKIKSGRYDDTVIPLQTQGGVQEVLCIPLTKLNGWLFSVNPAKVRRDIREKIIRYQEECFIVLHNYWFNGAAKNPRVEDRLTTAKERNALAVLVNQYCGKDPSRECYKAIWRTIHEVIGIKTVEELTVSQLPKAMAFMNAMVGNNTQPAQSELAIPEEALISAEIERAITSIKDTIRRAKDKGLNVTLGWNSLHNTAVLSVVKRHLLSC